jgi:putative transposase
LRNAHQHASQRIGFAVVHYSVQSDHLHLLIEADGNTSLARGIRSLTVRLARSLNELLGRSGRVFGDRYHLHVLTTPRQVHHALPTFWGTRSGMRTRSVKLPKDFVDPISSSFLFDVPEPSSWLMRKGWQMPGLLNIQCIPI